MDNIQTAIAFLATQLVGFLLGIVASLVASVLFARLINARKRREYGSLAGVWVEANSLLSDRPFAVCEFFFSPSDGKLKFEGHSYDNDGNEYYKWWSVVLRIDDRERRMPYVYETQRVGETKKDEGFGCLFLYHDETTKRWIAQRGYFLDLEEAKPRFTRMLSFETVATAFKRDLDGRSRSDRKILIRELLKHKDSTSLKELFGWE